MLIKLVADSTVPIEGVKHHTECDWNVQDNQPFASPGNITALFRAFAVNTQANFNFSGCYLLLKNGVEVDPKKTPASQNLMNGCAMTITKVPPPPMPTSRPGTGREESASAASPLNTARSAFADDGDDPEEEEMYDAVESGWFPVLTQGQDSCVQFVPGADVPPPNMADGGTVYIFNQKVEPVVADAHPHVTGLCGTCSDLMQNIEKLSVPVERHIKPMILDNESVSGFLEKMSNGTIKRWQQRWFMATEKALEYYPGKPSNTEQRKVREVRYLLKGTEPQLTHIIDSQDLKDDPKLQEEYPKCKDCIDRCFVLKFIPNPDKPKQNPNPLFRADSEAEKKKFVNFFKQLLKRFATKGEGQRDPVFWKRWDDALLVNAANVVNVSYDTQARIDNLNETNANLAAQLHEIQTIRNPELANVLEAERVSVIALEQQLAQLNDQIVATEHQPDAIEKALEEKRADVTKVVNDVEEEWQHMLFMEERALRQREEALDKIDALQAAIDEAIRKKRELFTSWKKLEEHHRDLSGRKGKDDKWNNKMYSFSLQPGTRVDVNSLSATRMGRALRHSLLLTNSQQTRRIQQQPEAPSALTSSASYPMASEDDRQRKTAVIAASHAGAARKPPASPLLTRSQMTPRGSPNAAALSPGRPNASSPPRYLTYLE